MIIDYPGVDMSRIYPLQQQKVANIISAIKDDSRVDCVILFGSSVNMRCTIHSDLDFVVKLKDISTQSKNEVSEKIQEACDWSADILWFDHLSEKDRVFQEMRMGVKIYE